MKGRELLVFVLGLLCAFPQISAHFSEVEVTDEDYAKFEEWLSENGFPRHNLSIATYEGYLPGSSYRFTPFFPAVFGLMVLLSGVLKLMCLLLVVT